MLGYRSVREMRAGLTLREYQHWAFLDETRQVGPRREDLRAASLAGCQGAPVGKTLEAWELQPPQNDDDLKALFMAMCGV